MKYQLLTLAYTLKYDQPCRRAISSSSMTLSLTRWSTSASLSRASVKVPSVTTRCASRALEPTASRHNTPRHAAVPEHGLCRSRSNRLQEVCQGTVVIMENSVYKRCQVYGVFHVLVAPGPSMDHELSFGGPPR